MQRERAAPTAGATGFEDVVQMWTKDAWSKQLDVLAKGVVDAEAAALVGRPAPPPAQAVVLADDVVGRPVGLPPLGLPGRTAVPTCSRAIAPCLVTPHAGELDQSEAGIAVGANDAPMSPRQQPLTPLAGFNPPTSPCSPSEAAAAVEVQEEADVPKIELEAQSAAVRVVAVMRPQGLP